MPESTLVTVLAGRRPLPPEFLDAAAETLKEDGEHVDTARDKIAGVSEHRASRTNFARGLEAELRVGYVNWPPFAWNDTSSSRPRGLLPDLLELLFTLMGIRNDRVLWQEVPFGKINRGIETDAFDLVTGFVLQTVSRRARARFVELEMPFAVGVNALTRSPRFHENMTFRKFLEELGAGVTSRDGLNIVTVASEIGDEYFKALLPLVPPPRMPDPRSIRQTIEDAMRYQNTVIIVDHISCVLAAKEDPSRRVILNPPIGHFTGGFILPADDPDWAEFFADSIHHLLSSRLPGIADIFESYATELDPFIDSPKALSEWLEKYWPDSQLMPWPTAWQTKIDEYQKKIDQQQKKESS